MRLVFAIAALVFAWLLPAGILLVAVPRVKKRCDEFGLQLPEATKIAFDLGALVSDNLIPTLVGLMFVVVAIVAVSLIVTQVRSVPRVARVLWWATAPIPPLLAAAFLAFAIALPMMKLAEGLGK